jgi:hypothetical protein
LPAWSTERGIHGSLEIDLVICLDTSGSMSGLIDTAKEKLWAIVNEMDRAEPTPVLRVGLLTYGNDGHLPRHRPLRTSGWSFPLSPPHVRVRFRPFHSPLAASEQLRRPPRWVDHRRVRRRPPKQCRTFRRLASSGFGRGRG